MNCAEQAVLLVDDEELFLKSARLILLSEGFTDVDLETDSRKVEERLRLKPYGIVALDMTMPHLTGRELLDRITRNFPDITVIIITGNSEVQLAVDCMKAGAFDYILKPLDRETLVARFRQALQRRISQGEADALKDHLLSGRLNQPEVFEGITTRSAVMEKIFEYAEAVSKTGLPILITGETGTGKELMARAIHGLYRPKGPFVAVNTAGLDDAVFADTLFGHVRGAFTGADKARGGLIEEAANGTLFLDEIGGLRLEPQLKLLRLIQEGEYFPVGSDRPKRSKARLVFATNTLLDKDAAFRKDLYYRLRTHEIRLPALRERREDIPLLARSFLEEAAAQFDKKVGMFDPESLAGLAVHDFPGNIRELKAIIFDAVSSHKDGPLTLPGIKGEGLPCNNGSSGEPGLSFTSQLPTLSQAENLLINEALKRAGGNKSLAALMLGITRQTLNNRSKDR